MKKLIKVYADEEDAITIILMAKRYGISISSAAQVLVKDRIRVRGQRGKEDGLLPAARAPDEIYPDLFPRFRHNLYLPPYRPVRWHRGRKRHGVITGAAARDSGPLAAPDIPREVACCDRRYNG